MDFCSPQASLYKKTKMCAFVASTGCFHGAACDYAHDNSELQSPPDLRKSTMCINFSRGRCFAESCKFAHGYDELRAPLVLPQATEMVTCPMWASSRCSLGSMCRYSHSWDSAASPSESSTCKKTKLFLSDVIVTDEKDSNDNLSSASTVISIDIALSAEAVARHRLVLFDSLTFDDEAEKDADSLLSCISKEVLRLDLRESPTRKKMCISDSLDEGDTSPWNLPH